MASQIKTKYIEDGAIDGLKILLQTDQTLRRLMEDGSTQDVIAYLEDSVTALQGAGDVLFEDDATVYADATAPIEDPTGRDGWYYKSSGSDKVNWYFHDGQTNPVTVAQWETLYTVATVDSSSNDTFHLAYYTFPLGDGQDAGAWYRSRIVYVPSGEFERGVKTLFYMGQEPDASVYPDLPRVQMTVSTVAGSSVGLNEDTEVIMTSVFGTNSGASAGTVEILVNRLGFNSSVYNKEYSLEIRGEFTLAGIKQSLLEEAIARQNADSTLQSNIDSEESSRIAADSTLQSNIDVEKGRIDAILSASQADKDSFAEIVSLINSVDTENDQAFAGYVASNDAALATEVTDRTNADSALQAQINNLSGELGTPEIEKFTLTAQNISDQYVDLAQDVDSSKYKRMQIFVGRLAMHLDDDFTLSSVSSVTRVTFAGSMANGGAEALAEGDVLYIRYIY